ncbi:MerR family transcriptional regulator [Suipraeoptans intestinalis]|uniref:MerR family transcriptional regulator n=1 Tax=Suipraeoptans intestinalis TaxID=2606628 RepID=UPI0023F2F7C8|nr:MerR family transcriptional regulator [Suipraeoptans intestinalis]MDD7770132.1 MerR family transcriptional regulator [Suipraeoptans intestinalis]MDY3121450.1 MerR family transcriptional regulator [Suipraeoptans intestinalis]
MTIKEVSEKFDLTPDTLRYYERVGVIPAVNRTKGGIRDYSEQDIKWIENAVCMRSAGVPVEMLIEYVKLFQEGDSTITARRDLLMEVRIEVQKQLDKYQATMDRINYKISRYEEAVKTGILIWDAEEIQ